LIADCFAISRFFQSKTHGRKPPVINLRLKHRLLYGKYRQNKAGKELDTETGLYYYGARYLDPKTSRWMSGDPALGEYLPSAPVNDEARRRNGNLPGQGGVFNYVNLHVYHYAGNNPVKYIDPDGEEQTSAQKTWTQTLSKMDVKDRISILILRTKADNGRNGTYFRSTLHVMWGNKLLNTVDVQSTADHLRLNQDAAHEGRTIPTGNYTGTLMDKSGTYLEPIGITGNGVEASEYILIHPNVVTNPDSPKYPGGPYNPPGSLGCQISNLEDYNEVMNILHTLRFEVDDTIKIQILNKGYEE
jgi:RHS repeat-associated protein